MLFLRICETFFQQCFTLHLIPLLDCCHLHQYILTSLPILPHTLHYNLLLGGQHSDCTLSVNHKSGFIWLPTSDSHTAKYAVCQTCLKDIINSSVVYRMYSFTDDNLSTSHLIKAVRNSQQKCTPGDTQTLFGNPLIQP